MTSSGAERLSPGLPSEGRLRQKWPKSASFSFLLPPPILNSQNFSSPFANALYTVERFTSSAGQSHAQKTFAFRARRFRH